MNDRRPAARRPSDIMLHKPIVILGPISLLVEQVLAILHIVIVLDPIVKRLLEELLQVELLPIKLSYIVFLGALLEMGDQRDKLLVLRVLLERSNRYAISQLLTERIEGVVDEQDVFQRDILEHPQVLYVLTPLRPNAALPVKSVLNQLSLRIEVIDDGVGVLRGARGKDGDLIVAIRCDKKLLSVWSDIETDIFDNLAAGCCDVNPDIGLSEGIRLLDAMDESLVEIEQQELRNIPLLEFHFNLFLIDLLFRYFHVLQ